VLCGVLTNSEINFDRKELVLTLAAELEPLDILILERIYQKQADFFNIKELNPLFDYLVSVGYPGTKDEFAYSLNKLESRSMIRKRPGVELTGEVPSPDVWGSEEDGRLPAIMVTELGQYLRSLVSINFKTKR
jgi:hypothetical protein